MRVHHLAFRTHDVARLAAFYETVLGLPRVPGARDEARSVWLGAGDAIVMIERAEDDEPAVARGAMDLVAFAIDAREMDAWRARLAGAGVAIEGATSFTLYFRDPDGRRIGVSSYEGSR